MIDTTPGQSSTEYCRDDFEHLCQKASFLVKFSASRKQHLMNALWLRSSRGLLRQTQRLTTRPYLFTHNHERFFITTAPVQGQKRAAKQAHQDAKETAVPIDVDDFQKLQDNIKKSLDTLSRKLTELKADGASGTVEKLRVLHSTTKADHSQPSKIVLGDIAQIVTKGQHVHVIVSSEDVCIFTHG
jgi:hypothetical protein